MSSQARPFPVVNVVLHQPEIPPNTGNIGRTVLGLNGCLHLVGRLGFRINEKTLRRAGLDYWESLQIKRWKTLSDLDLADKRFFLFTKIGQHMFYDVNYQLGDYLVFGSESRGLPAELLQQYSDQTVQFPTMGPVRSYNLASTVHSACMELVRQNHDLLHAYYQQLEREQPNT